MTKQLLSVEGTKVAVVSQGGEDYISLTDMVRDSENGSSVIENWLRNKNTLEFLSIWEEIYNPAFNSLEFEGVKNEAGLNRFAISVKQWIAKTAAIGVIAKAGRYGGTYASEADLLNVALFGTTAKQWRDKDPSQEIFETTQ